MCARETHQTKNIIHPLLRNAMVFQIDEADALKCRVHFVRYGALGRAVAGAEFREGNDRDGRG